MAARCAISCWTGTPFSGSPIPLTLLLEGVGIPSGGAALAGMGIIAGLRLAAILWRLELPAVQLPEDDAG
ncbi:MAG TPA: hypothetical protein VGP44_06625 [Gemmatimonadales bacterium]|nr:hypothetical protein [Gemmatimonadales bacterium]